MAGWVDGRVIERIDWHESLFSIRIEANIGGFQAGQFVKLALPSVSESGEKNLVARAYSMVNSEDSQLLEFLAVPVKKGTLSPRLHQLEPGDKISVSASATGFLILDELPDGKELWMMGTGTGIGPFLAILSSARVWQRFNTVVLVYAVRHVRDLAYIEHILNWKQQQPGLIFVPVISQENRDGALRGRIPALIKAGELERAAGISLNVESSRVMLCGNPGMLEDAMSELKEKGLSKHLRRKPGQVLMERYW